MDLQKIIDEMERKAGDYTRAANALRALMSEQGTAHSANTSAAVPTAPAAKRGRPSGAKPGKRTMSPEARAKIGAAMRARHQARRAAAA